MPSLPTILLSPSDIEHLHDVVADVKSGMVKQCLPIGLAFAIVLGLTAPIVGQAAASARLAGVGVVDTLCVWFIFFVSGLTLKTEDAIKALGARRALAWAIFSILGATPLVAPLASRLPPPFPAEFALGFAIFCAMPTTINTGVALTTQAKGSFALALVITVVTNLLAVFTVPFFLSAVLQLTAVRIDAVRLLLKLLVLILAPLVVGKGTRELSSGARAFAATHKQLLSLCSNGALVLIPWMKLSDSAAELRSARGLSLLLVVLLAFAIHALYLAFNALGCALLRLPDDERRAVVIMASQKTLPMAMAVLAAMPAEFGEPGLIAVPCIVSHILQIFVDAFIATRWSHIPPRAPGAEPHVTSSRLDEGGAHESVEMAAPLSRSPHASHDEHGADRQPGGRAAGRDEHEREADAARASGEPPADDRSPDGRRAARVRGARLLADAGRGERSDDRGAV
ncbi:hypothetical protein KFE25_002453 [Diacronema lutheri]|uniref:Bile acid:sodium symporter n=2 Tax=Diacronema lutheri TaxID=2081491 RepID=A0A8J5XBS9_DIALT|nr:hypothetical protein KFE25_002453 [Diacronema lutheri]